MYAIHLDLVPVQLGRGVRFLGDFAGDGLLLENPRAIEDDRGRI